VEWKDSTLDNDVLKKVLTSDAERIKVTLEEIDGNAFDMAVEKICKARKIYVIGIRSSATLASFLSHSLKVIFDNVISLEALSSEDLFEEMLDISDDDVLVAISFPRYSNRVIRAVDFAKSHGANVIAITDSYTSPIAENASEVLVARSDMISYVDSLVAPLSLINALIIGISKRMQEQLEKRLQTLEAIWDEYQVYDKSHS
jgi:DNA-binding MurR/RpiR family transcriptional regulator